MVGSSTGTILASALRLCPVVAAVEIGVAAGTAPAHRLTAVLVVAAERGTCNETEVDIDHVHLLVEIEMHSEERRSRPDDQAPRGA